MSVKGSSSQSCKEHWDPQQTNPSAACPAPRGLAWQPTAVPWAWFRLLALGKTAPVIVFPVSNVLLGTLLVLTLPGQVAAPDNNTSSPPGGLEHGSSQQSCFSGRLLPGFTPI